MEEMTTENIEQETQEQEQTEQETPTEIQTESPLSSEPVIIESLPDNSENIIHELFAELGVNLDYTPQNNFQCFTMSLQFLAALWFIWWLVKYMFQLMRQLFTVGR